MYFSTVQVAGCYNMRFAERRHRVTKHSWYITPNKISHFLTSLGAQVKTDFTHPCCDQLTAVKKGYPLTNIT